MFIFKLFYFEKMSNKRIMPENPKKKREAAEKSEEKSEKSKNSSWSKDQQEKGYYYDDAHGYQIYNPDEDKDDEDEDELKNG